MSLLFTLTAFGTLAFTVGAATPGSEPAGYSEGQVWEYRTRPGDEASRLKIQKIETLPGDRDRIPVYHITIVGVNLGSESIAGVIQHAPVSKQTLDASVTRLSDSKVDLSAEEGIDEWRRADGGVFTITVAEIVRLLAETVAKGMPKPD